MKDNFIYWMVHRWAGSEAVLPALANEVKSVTCLATGRAVDFERRSNGRLVLTGLPDTPPDMSTTVFKIEVEGRPTALPRPDSL
jgi:hypothetical protein